MSSPARGYETARPYTPPTSNFDATAQVETSVSAVSWPAVFAGAFVSAAMSVTIMTLGAGVSLSSISPWPDAARSASRLTPLAVIFIILAQIVSAAIGGYLAGRLRTKWVSLHTHEVYFRDTAHGFLAWAVGLVIGMLLLAFAVTRNTMPSQSAQSHLSGYYADRLLRSARAENATNETLAHSEAALILDESLARQALAPEDRTYLTQLVSARTGLGRTDAEKRVDDTMAEVRYAADNARKSLAHSFYWLFVALLCGAFCSSYAATMGGRQRDNIPAHASV
jgi:hypothetical protein